MAIYWHPFLTQFLRQDYGSLLAIEDEVNLGEMPLRLDLLLIPRYNDFADDISLPGGAQIADMQEIGLGVRGGTLDDFPIFLIDLGVLPVSAATLPLVMAAKGENERALVEFLLDKHEEYASYIGYLIELHGDMLMEERSRQIIERLFPQKSDNNDD